MERDMTEQAAVGWAEMSDAEVGELLSKVEWLWEDRFSEAAQVVIAEAARRLQGRDGGTVA